MHQNMPFPGHMHDHNMHMPNTTLPGTLPNTTLPGMSYTDLENKLTHLEHKLKKLEKRVSHIEGIEKQEHHSFSNSLHMM